MSDATALYAVLPGFALRFPDLAVRDRLMRVWATEGSIVDLSDPYVVSLVEGQWHKLRAISEDEAGDRRVWRVADAPEPIPRLAMEHRLRTSKNTSKAAEATEREAREPETPRPPAPTPGRAKRRAADIEAVLAEGAE